MRQLRISLALPLILGVCGALFAKDLDQEAKWQSALRTLEAARSAVFDARLRRAELNIERRLAEQVPSPISTARNPAWDRWNAELRAAEGRSQRLSEKLAPAHPEMLAAESELQALRDQLEAMPEFLPSTPPAKLERNRADELSLARRIQSAERDVEAAENGLAQAANNYQAILTSREEKPSAVPATVDSVAPSTAIPGWVWPVGGGLLALMCVRRGRSRTDKIPSTSTQPVHTVKRLVYSMAPTDRGSPPPAAEFRLLENAGPKLIIPRRRSA